MFAEARPALLLAFLVLAPSVPAFGPGADAGTGSDAGDFGFVATPIAPGRHEGSWHTRLDRDDFYAFAGSAGQRVRLGLEAEAAAVASLVRPGSTPSTGEGGTPYGSVFNNDQRDFVLPFDGPWLLRLHLIQAPSDGVQPYAFDLGVDWAPSTLLAAGREPFHVLEARWDASAPAWSWAQLRPPRNVTDGYSALIALEMWTSEGPWRNAVHVAFGGTGRWIVTPAVEAPLPEGVHASTNVLGEFVAIGLWTEGGAASLRVTGYQTRPEGELVLWAVTDAPWSSADSTEAEPFAWWTAEDARPGDVVVPGASRTGPRERELEIAGPFAGHFQPGPSGGAMGPHGSVPLNPRCGCLFLFGPAIGSWTFHDGDATRAALGVERPLLDGVHLPALGLAEP